MMMLIHLSICYGIRWCGVVERSHFIYHLMPVCYVWVNPDDLFPEDGKEAATVTAKSYTLSNGLNT